jgi:hypothetical protein
MSSVSIPFTNNTISLSETTTSITSAFNTTESTSPFDSSSSSPTTIKYNNETLTTTLFQNETQSSKFTESSTSSEQTTFITEILSTSKEPEKQEPACIVSLSNLVILTSSNDELSRFIQDSESQFANVKNTVSFFLRLIFEF